MPKRRRSARKRMDCYPCVCVESLCGNESRRIGTGIGRDYMGTHQDGKPFMGYRGRTMLAWLRKWVRLPPLLQIYVSLLKQIRRTKQ